MLPHGDRRHGDYVDGTDRQTDGRTDCLLLSLDAVSVGYNKSFLKPEFKIKTEIVRPMLIRKLKYQRYTA